MVERTQAEFIDALSCCGVTIMDSAGAVQVLCACSVTKFTIFAASLLKIVNWRVTVRTSTVNPFAPLNA